MINKNNKNPYGHLLDKYLYSNHIDYRTKQQREEEARKKYGHLLDYAKADYSTLELIAKMEDRRIESRKQAEKDKELEAQRRQLRFENERRKEEERRENNSKLVEAIMARKEARIKAAEEAEAERRREAERQQSMYDNIGGLMRISPNAADAFIRAMKEGNAL